MRKEWLLTLGTVIATVLIALVLIRWLAPGLLGYAVDQQLVQVSEEVPPFYENIFRHEDKLSKEFLINDPILISRAKPLFPDVRSMGPNDILGFRNRNVPNKADIIVIGDSQTYGNNAPLELNWPGVLQKEIAKLGAYRVYNMSVGAWGGLNYLEISRFALSLRPSLIVVAYYTGNDPYSDFRNAYSNERWSRFRVDPTIDVEDMQKVVFPPPVEERWTAKYTDGQQIQFTPKYRYISNRYDDPVVRAGYRIMAKTAHEIAVLANEHNVKIVFTIIPSKELVYAGKELLDPDGIDPVYAQHVFDEQRNIDELENQLSTIPNSRYLRVIEDLQKAALGDVPLYPHGSDGHPIAAGYSIIGKTIASRVTEALPEQRLGAIALSYDGNIIDYQLHTKHGRWSVGNTDLMIGNGWSEAYVMNVEEVPEISYLGIIDRVDPGQFGPDALKGGH